MSYFKSFNKQIACKPPNKIEQQQSKKVGGLFVVDEKVSLTALEVVFDSDLGFDTGDKIYVHSVNASKHAWLGAKFEAGGIEFILVPVEFVLLAESPQA